MKIISLILLVYGFHYESHRPARVNFSIYNAGIEVTGSVDSVRAIVHFDPSNISESYVEAWAIATTVRTGISIRDKHLKRADYFDVENHPVIHLKSKRLRKTGRNKVTGDFDLTIKGITRSVPATFIISTHKGHSSYRSTFELNRLDFNIGEESITLDNKVMVDVIVD